MILGIKIFFDFGIFDNFRYFWKFWISIFVVLIVIKEVAELVKKSRKNSIFSSTCSYSRELYMLALIFGSDAAQRSMTFKSEKKSTKSCLFQEVEQFLFAVRVAG